MVIMRTALYLLLAASSSIAQQSVPEGYIPLKFTPNATAPGMKVEDLGAAGHAYKISLRKGDEIMSALAQFATRDQIRQAHFTGIGAIDSGLFGWYDPALHADKKIAIDSEAEIVSLTGDITEGRDGKPRIHAHISVAFSDGSLKGGHLFEARISLVGQIYVTVHDTAGPDARPAYNSIGF